MKQEKKAWQLYPLAKPRDWWAKAVAPFNATLPQAS